MSELEGLDQTIAAARPRAGRGDGLVEALELAHRIQAGARVAAGAASGAPWGKNAATGRTS